MTVSRVINGDAGVRDEVRAHVSEVIATLNYTPNLMARSLVTSREIRIGVIYSNPSAAFMSELLVGVFEEASTRAAQLFLLKGEQGQPPTREAIEGLIHQRIAGLIRRRRSASPASCATSSARRVCPSRSWAASPPMRSASASTMPAPPMT